jgi:hypothetical protein
LERNGDDILTLFSAPLRPILVQTFELNVIFSQIDRFGRRKTPVMCRFYLKFLPDKSEKVNQKVSQIELKFVVQNAP